MRKPRTSYHSIAALLTVLVLGACAKPALPPAAVTLASPAPTVLQGKFALKYEERHASAAFRWQLGAEHSQLDLLSPLGQTIGRLSTRPGSSTLEIGSEAPVTADSPEALLHSRLGWSLPLAGLQDWLFARPAPGVPAELTTGADGLPSQIRQDGWVIDYTQYVPALGGQLPARMTLSRPSLSARIIINQWQAPLAE